MEVTVEAPENKQANKQKTLDYQIAQEYPYRGHTQRTLRQHTLDTHILMSTVYHTITIAKTWNQHGCPPADKRINGMRCIPTTDAFPDAKKKQNHGIFFFRKLDEVGNHCVNEISQAQKDKHCVCFHSESRFKLYLWVDTYVYV